MHNTPINSIQGELCILAGPGVRHDHDAVADWSMDSRNHPAPPAECSL